MSLNKSKFEGLISAIVVKSPESVALPKYIAALITFLKKRFDNYEIICVDNGTYSSKTFLSISKSHMGVRVLRLSNNISLDQAFLVGVDNSIGDYVVTIDPHINGFDYIDSFISSLQLTSSDLVVGFLTKKYSNSIINKLGSRLFHWYIGRVLKMRIHNNTSFALGMTRRMVNLISSSRSYYRNMHYLAYRTGLKVTNIRVKYSYPVLKPDKIRLIPQAFDIVLQYSNHPLRIVSILGMLATMANLFYVLYVLFIYIFKANVAEGWTTMSLQMSLLFFFTFFILTVFSEYIGRIFDEIRHDQRYFITEEIKSEVLVADELRRNVVSR